MDLIRIYDRESTEAQRIFSSYESTFPEHERRSQDQFKAMFDNDSARVFSITDNGENIGYIICWQARDFLFIEHFEVFADHRNKSYGSKILALMKDKFNKIVLESEPADLDEIAARRIDFYQRNGYSVVDEDYLQPSYEAGKAPVQLWLMANFPADTELISREIYDVVYGVQD